ncbi:uncharacterized protein LOC111633199 isoform X2 [Centruroides sculpturatus]|uniref:uncharacterized protein LOC111633199 isoform X2 n=1 Tax=Centruroides sculpturatus TaxID=218467 RepID=UPI000C6E00B4|nr:uncharacterized protein LOC111633199 isoform X2 [Centruroides sculpturatus]
MKLSVYFSYMQKHGLCKNASLPELAMENELLTGKQSTLIVDFSGIHKMEYFNTHLSYTCNHHIFIAQVKSFVNNLRIINIEPQFYFKGALQGFKEIRQNKRIINDNKIAWNILRWFRDNFKFILQYYADNTLGKMYSIFSYILKYECQCHVLIVRENFFSKLATIARDDDACLGILTTNAEYLIYDTKPIFRFTDLQFNSTITEMYDPNEFFTKISLNRSQLKLLSCLQREQRGITLANLENDNVLQLENTINVIKENKWNGNEQDMSSISEITGISENLLRKKVKMYGTSDTDVDELSHNKLLTYIEQKWTLCEMPPKIYFLLKNQKYIENLYLGDFADPSLPFSVSLYRTMRRKMYRVLFRGGNVYIMEVWIYNTVNMCRTSLISSFYMKYNDYIPPLEHLLSDEEYMVPIRWKLFAYCLGTNITIETLRQVEPTLLSFCCLVNYMIRNGVVLNICELNALILQAILVSNNCDSYKDNVVLNPRHIHLSRLYERGMYNLMNVLAVCGFPFSLEHVMHWKCFDITVFINVYNELIQGITTNNIDISLYEYVRLLCINNVKLRI